MILYSKNCPPVDPSKLEYFNEGNCAEIFYYYNLLMKIYKPDCNKKGKIKKSMFELLKTLNAPNIVKLQEYYTYNNKYKPRADAYTSIPIKGTPISLLECDRKHLIELFTQLEETLKILAENDIILYDIHKKNIIINENGISLIDPDLFSERNFLYTYSTYTINKAKLVDLLNSLLYKEQFDKDETLVYYFIKKNDKNTLLEDIKNSLTENTFYESIKSKKLKK